MGSAEINVVMHKHQPSIVLEVRKGEEKLDGVTVTVLQTALAVGGVAIGALDCLVFRSDGPMDSDRLRQACAGRLWDLHEIVEAAFCARGRMDDCFAEGAFVVLEHIDIKPEYRRSGYGERALRSLLTQHMPKATWLYANVDDPYGGERVEQWLNKTFPSHEMSPGSYAYMRYRVGSTQHGA